MSITLKAQRRDDPDSPSTLRFQGSAAKGLLTKLEHFSAGWGVLRHRVILSSTFANSRRSGGEGEMVEERFAEFRR